MLAQMAAMKLQENEHAQKGSGTKTDNMQETRKVQIQKNIVSKSPTIMMQEDRQRNLVVINREEGHMAAKRPRMELETSTMYDTIMAEPAQKANQGP
jgi:hypothetical protein